LFELKSHVPSQCMDASCVEASVVPWLTTSKPPFTMLPAKKLAERAAQGERYGDMSNHGKGTGGQFEGARGRTGRVVVCAARSREVAGID